MEPQRHDKIGAIHFMYNEVATSMQFDVIGDRASSFERKMNGK